MDAAIWQPLYGTLRCGTMKGAIIDSNSRMAQKKQEGFTVTTAQSHDYKVGQVILAIPFVDGKKVWGTWKIMSVESDCSFTLGPLTFWDKARQMFRRLWRC